MFQSRLIPSPANMLPGVIDAVKAAGALIRAEFHRGGGPRGKHDKGVIPP